MIAVIGDPTGLGAFEPDLSGPLEDPLHHPDPMLFPFRRGVQPGVERLGDEMGQLAVRLELDLTPDRGEPPKERRQSLGRRLTPLVSTRPPPFEKRDGPRVGDAKSKSRSGKWGRPAETPAEGGQLGGHARAGPTQGARLGRLAPAGDGHAPTDPGGVGPLLDQRGNLDQTLVGSQSGEVFRGLEDTLGHWVERPGSDVPRNTSASRSA